MEVRKKMVSVAASSETEQENLVGWSFLYRNRNLARSIRAEIHSVRVVSGADIASCATLWQFSISWVVDDGKYMSERNVRENREAVVVVHALFGFMAEMRGTNNTGKISFSIFSLSVSESALCQFFVKWLLEWIGLFWLLPLQRK